MRCSKSRRGTSLCQCRACPHNGRRPPLCLTSIPSAATTRTVGFGMFEELDLDKFERLLPEGMRAIPGIGDEPLS